jgi:hypothetical protein
MFDRYVSNFSLCFCLAFLLLGLYAVGEIAIGLFECGIFCYWTFLMWEKLLLDFFKVGQNAAGFSSYWTNELHSHPYILFFLEKLKFYT